MRKIANRIRQALLRVMAVGLLLVAGTCAQAQINADRVLLMGRNALYYEDYVLAIQRFNLVINATI